MAIVIVKNIIRLVTLIVVLILYLDITIANDNQNITQDILNSMEPQESDGYLNDSLDTSTIVEMELSEINNKSNDSDDGLADYEKIALEANISKNDTDGDGLNDTEESWWACYPTVRDTDGDGYSDGDEVHLPIGDPNKGDGCPYTKDSLGDNDKDVDGLPVGAELNVLKTDPTSPSSDGDRYSDGIEVLGFDFYGIERMPDYVDHDPLSPATADLVLEMDPKVKLNLATKVKEQSKTLDSWAKALNAERGFKEAATLKIKAGTSVSSEVSAGYPPWGTSAKVKSEVHLNVDLEAEAGFSASQRWTTKHDELKETLKVEETDLSGSTLQVWVNIKNIGDDLVYKGIDELKINLYMGDDEEPFYTYDNPPEDVIGRNLKPGNQFKITIKDIEIDYELFKRIISGEGVRAGIAHYSFGDDQIYLSNARARCVEIDLDDGTGLIKLRVAPSAEKITLYDALNLSGISVVLENGTIKSINGKEIKSGSPPYMWWNFIIIKQQVEGTKSPDIKYRNQSDDILKADVYPGDLVLLKYQMDSDGDLLPDAEERIIGTRADRQDTDKDGLWDGDSIPEQGVKGENEFGTNPLLEDTDNDGLIDSMDPEPLDGLYVSPDVERPDSVIVYDHKDYKGISKEFWDDSPNLGELNDKIQSLKVPWGCHVQLFENPDYNGSSKIFTNDTPWVGDDFFDTASSMKVKRIALFDHSNYAGKSKVIVTPEVQYIGQEFDDKVESLTVPDGYNVVLYENENFTGKEATYLVDSEWVGIDLHDSVSSIKVKKECKLPPSSFVVTAVRYDGKLRNIAWQIDEDGNIARKGYADAGTIDMVDAIYVGEGYFVTAVRYDGKLRNIAWQINNDGNIVRKGYADAGRIDMVDAISVGEGYFVTAVRYDGKLRNIAWQINNEGNIVRKGYADAGRIDMVDAISVGEGYFVTAVRYDGKLRNIAWQIDNEGNIVRKGYGDAGKIGQVDAISVGEGYFVTAVQLSDGNLRNIAWQIDNEGNIVRKGYADAEKIHRLDAISVGEGYFVTAVRTDGKLRNIAWQIDSAGNIVRKDTVDAGSIDLLDAVYVGEGYFVTAVRTDGKLRNIAWQIDSAGNIVRKGYADAGKVSQISIESVTNLSC